MSTDLQHILLMLGVFALGAVIGLGARPGERSGWPALAFPLVLIPGGIALTMIFC